MDKDDIAQAVLSSLGGRENVQYNTVCMTRLRVTLVDPAIVDYQGLNEINSVLGTATRGQNGIEVVFGPRVIDGVYHAFVSLTGVQAGTDALFPMSRQESSMRIQINPPKQREPEGTSVDVPLMDEDELSMLDDLFGETEPDASGYASEKVGDARILVVNGPNINMLGMSPFKGFPITDYPSLLELCKAEAQRVGFSRCDCFQSNHEGDLIDSIQDAYGVYHALIVNPGPLTMPSPALYAAIYAVDLPTVVVNLFEPTPLSFPQLEGTPAVTHVAGKGVEGYREAIAQLADQVVA
ncbi:MAG: type II 3-dehydroquinate dehydratase [Coriobacteriales bacterium]|nr:type II 3-dehydroquinate dehydratase [Coriobacteriales bacterium]